MRSHLAYISSVIILFAGNFTKPAIASKPASATSQSSIEVTTTSQPGGELKLQFKTVPAKGLKINTDGPWSLEFKDHPGLEVTTKKLGKSDFAESIPGFTMTSKPSAKSGKISFKMVVFVCTETKSQCFRDVHQGSVDWAAK